MFINIRTEYISGIVCDEKGNFMAHNPDIYLLYEYMDKLSFTFRIKVRLTEAVDADVLKEAAQKAFERFPYFRVKVGLDTGGNFTLEPNEKPIAVLPEENKRIALGSPEVNEHLFVITYRNDRIWFSCSHAPCGSYGAMFWIKTTLFLYLSAKYGHLEPPADLKLPGTPVAEGETFYPDVNALPTDEPLIRYTGGDCNYAIGRMIKYLLNPFAKDDYYYEIEIPSKAFMDYAKSIDASPNSLLISMMYKAMTRFFKEKEGTHISGRLAADYRDDIGASGSYRDFVRFIHIRYEWDMKDDPLSKLNMVARGAIIAQNQPELSFERFRRLESVHREIDAKPDLKEKKKYASQNSAFRKDPRDAYTLSYVGQLGLGEMEKYIRSIYTITNGDLMLELNALTDHFNIAFQVVGKSREPLDRFLEVLDQEGIPCKVSGRKTRYLPRVILPK